MIKGINLFEKDNILYYVGSLILALLVGYYEGWGYLLQYASILAGLFLPSVIILQLFVFIRQLINKMQFKISEIVSFIICLLIMLVVFLYGLEAKQRMFLFVLNTFAISGLLIVLFYMTIKKKTK